MLTPLERQLKARRAEHGEARGARPGLARRMERRPTTGE
jgi:hypothetical protein